MCGAVVRGRRRIHDLRPRCGLCQRETVFRAHKDKDIHIGKLSFFFSFFFTEKRGVIYQHGQWRKPLIRLLTLKQLYPNPITRFCRGVLVDIHPLTARTAHSPEKSPVFHSTLRTSIFHMRKLLIAANFGQRWSNLEPVIQGRWLALSPPVVERKPRACLGVSKTLTYTLIPFFQCVFSIVTFILYP